MDKYFVLAIYLLFIGAVIVAVNAEQGIKGGHNQRYASRNSMPTNETGYCFRRIPSSQINSHENRSDHPYTRDQNSYSVQPNHQWNSTATSRWITIIDCCDEYYRDPYTHRCITNHTDLTEQSLPCEENCLAGECIEGVCHCEPGWHQSEGVCKPVCRHPCQQNAYCFSPDVCECKLGYEESPYGDCRPICLDGCINGDCIAPRICRCHPGYILNGVGQRCEPVCKGECTHGQCKSPGVCSCDPGYINSPHDHESCVPDCGPNNCNGGQCISPGVCNCRPGFIRDSSSNDCIPECRNGCPINARCIAPNRCECNSGFELDRYNNRCIVISESYNNNQNGSGDDNHQEQGHCDRQCINAICIGYNICSCKDGYTPDPRDSTRTRCVASCPGGCINGVCSAPNFCICNPGYIKDRAVKGSQRCIPHYNY